MIATQLPLVACRYLPAFETCARAGVMHLMCSYNLLNSVPACVDGALINGLVRAQWGWDGFVVSGLGCPELPPIAPELPLIAPNCL